MIARPLLIVLFALAAACATARPPAGSDVATRLRTGTGADARLDPAAAAGLPPSVDAGDGLSSDEAVSIALWNNAAFQVTVSQLGFAKADLVEAGLLANPVLSLLFPLGPKQLEATLRWPAELLRERPRRQAATAPVTRSNIRWRSSFSAAW